MHQARVGKRERPTYPPRTDSRAPTRTPETALDTPQPKAAPRTTAEELRREAGCSVSGRRPSLPLHDDRLADTHLLAPPRRDSRGHWSRLRRCRFQVLGLNTPESLTPN